MLCASSNIHFIACCCVASLGQIYPSDEIHRCWTMHDRPSCVLSSFPVLHCSENCEGDAADFADASGWDDDDGNYDLTS
jgi:hypothetical protein